MCISIYKCEKARTLPKLESWFLDDRMEESKAC